MEAGLVLHLLGPDYRIVQLYVHPCHAGHAGIARYRTYVIYYNCSRLEFKYDAFELYHAISHEIQKVVRTSPNDYLVSTETTRILDLMSFARKRGIQFIPESCIAID